MSAAGVVGRSAGWLTMKAILWVFLDRHQAELLVWDTAGNMKRCHLTSGEQRQQRDGSTEASGAGQITLTGFFFIMLGLLWSPLI